MMEKGSVKGETRMRSRFKEPRRYKVIMYNDDITTFDFVEMVLMKVFHKSQDEAGKLAADVHVNGKAVVGVYSFDVAHSRCRRVTKLAYDSGYPLRMECVPEDDK